MVLKIRTSTKSITIVLISYNLKIPVVEPDSNAQLVIQNAQRLEQLVHTVSLTKKKYVTLFCIYARMNLVNRI
jgi:hypothetical protein